MKRIKGSLIRKPVMALAVTVLALVFGAEIVLSQGVVNFSNSGTFFPVADRRVYDPTTCAPLVGTNWVAALYFGTTPDAITELAVRSFDDLSLLRAIGHFRAVDPSSASAGTWSGGLRILLGVTVGQTLTMQVRVWDLNRFATFDDARTMGGFALESAPFSYLVPGILDGGGDKLNNFQGITPPECVPEPSVFALAGLGLAVLVAWQHRKVDRAAIGDPGSASASS